MDELVDMEVFPFGNNRDHRSQSRQRHRQPEPDIIDLTLDDESPPHPSLPFPGPPAQMNARRMNSQRSPPRLSRTDGSYIGGPPQVIFISDSDDDHGEPARPNFRRNIDNNRERRERQTRHHHHHHHTHHHHHHRPQQPVDELHEDVPREAPHFTRIASLLHNLPLPMFSFLNNHGMANRHGAEDIAFLGERNLGPQLPPINIGMRLDYGHNAFRGHQDPAPSPKPAHEPPKTAREGFTRDTGEDVVAICPSCDQELAYDPDGDEEEGAASSAATPSKKPRTKKDKAEHHFFAVKACGHVYCKKCYDNRKPSARNPVDVGFRPDLKTSKGKILCAVDECESDVTNKTAWVGIFL